LSIAFTNCAFYKGLRLQGSLRGLSLHSPAMQQGSQLEILLDLNDICGPIGITNAAWPPGTEISVRVAVGTRSSWPPYGRPKPPHIATLWLRDVQSGTLNIEAVTISRLDIERGANLSLEVDRCQIDSFSASHVNFPNGLFVRGTRVVSFFQVTDCTIGSSLDLTDSYVKKTSLRGTSIAVRANFDDSEFLGETDCHGLTVGSRVSLRGVKLGGPWHIRDATIDARTPDVRDIRAKHFEGEDVIYFYRALRRWAEDSKSQVDASRYFAYEQRAIRKTRFGRGNRFDPIVSALYDWISGYGNSIQRAFWVLVGWNAVFGAIFTFLKGASGGTSSVGSFLPPGVGLALQNMINPLVLFTEKPAFAPTSGVAFGLSLFQSLGSLAILALLILAMRRRFHKASE